MATFSAFSLRHTEDALGKSPLFVNLEMEIVGIIIAKTLKAKLLPLTRGDITWGEGHTICARLLKPPHAAVPTRSYIRTLTPCGNWGFYNRAASDHLLPRNMFNRSRGTCDVVIKFTIWKAFHKDLVHVFPNGPLWCRSDLFLNRWLICLPKLPPYVF